MNKGNRLQQLEDACRDIIKINMWYELPDYVFFSISDTIDGTSDEFAINVNCTPNVGHNLTSEGAVYETFI
ncbi:hypothetical protein [Escherichia coli]|uniref:hypothetical protein n=1 Tax=Escherichia coli TaxID=562 RepID=UPI0021BEDF91|nr:hypothetical protein [Escherichia coli]